MAIIINKPIGHKYECPDCKCIVGFKDDEPVFNSMKHEFYIECPNCRHRTSVKDKSFYDDYWLYGIEPWYRGDKS